MDEAPADQQARLHREWLERRTAARAAGVVPEARTDEDLRDMAAAARDRRGIVPLTPAEEARRAEWAAQQRALHGETLADVLARTPCPPGPAVSRRPVFMDTAETSDERIGRLAVERSWAAIPASFNCCSLFCPSHPIDLDHPDRCGNCGAPLVPLTWARLAALGGPMRSDGRRLAALGGVETRSGRVLHGAEAVREIQERIAAAGRAVLLGGTRAGKSVAAAAYADERLIVGVEGLRWVSALSLREGPMLERAKVARFLVLDDLGEELAMAPKGSGLAAQRVPPVCELFGALARSRGQGLLVSTFLDFDAMADFYGGGVAARVYEGAEVIRIVRPG